MSDVDEQRTDPVSLDGESAGWVARLQPASPDHQSAVAELHVLLLKAARFEVRRRRGALGEARSDEHEDLAHQSADDALVAVLRKLGDFRGDSRFTTWAYKFALLEAAVKVRRRAWQRREVQLDSEGWSAIAEGLRTPHETVEQRELIDALGQAIREELSARQREVLVAITIEDVPIDVLAERLQTTRGALYKTLYDARRKLRAALAANDLEPARRAQAVRR
jgi:RNA polymerase sigma-70 factor, ECF subfamily